MAVIQVNNLVPLGNDFFNDPETFMDEVSEGETLSINGGSTPTVTALWFVGGGVVGAGLSFGATWLAGRMGWT